MPYPRLVLLTLILSGLAWGAGARELPADPPRHWAYQPLRRPALPSVVDRSWPLGPLDQLVRAQLEDERLSPAPRADNTTLLRRATLALTGLPPTLDELDAFEQLDQAVAPDAYQRALDRLLASPHHGERMAQWWLDLARYADTHGYHADTHRDMWRWRDWVIDAFNRGLPFDRFSIEQLAGDLLPNATVEQRLATGFLRNHMVIFEDGVIDEEYRDEYVADRVATVGAVWLGQTLQCARCHDHKYDPFTQRDYYRFYAFFNNVAEKGVDGRYGNAAPILTVPSDLQLAAEQRLLADIARREEQIAEQLARRDDPRQTTWEAKRTRGAPAPPADAVLHFPLNDPPGNKIRNRADERPSTLRGPVSWVPARENSVPLFGGETWIEAGPYGDFDLTDDFSFSAWIWCSASDDRTIVARQQSGADPRGYDLSVIDGRLRWRMLAEPQSNELSVTAEPKLTPRRWHHVAVTVSGRSGAAGVRLYHDGQVVAVTVDRNLLTRSPRNAAPLEFGRRGDSAYWRGMLDDLHVFERVLSAAEVAALAKSDLAAPLLAIQPGRRTPAQAATLRRLFLESTDAAFQDALKSLAARQRELAEWRKTYPTAMVMEERQAPRATFVLQRGQYNLPGERVTAGTPASLPPLGVNSAPSTVQIGSPSRLDLAKWLFAPEQPLTARVIASRIWQLHFGIGLVPTADDFGTRGERPTHPPLLDWLAADLRRDWDLKRVQRELLRSATFCQSNQLDRGAYERDPDNRFLARGPRWRMPAEMIRDVALASSGLLDRTVGGPSVFPYQPPGLWEELAYDPQALTAQVFRPSHGSGLVRRGLYTYWKRAALAPPLAAFDAPDREVCALARPTSTTAQQALVLMNETARWESARGLAQRTWHDVVDHADAAAMVQRMMRQVSSQPATNRHVELLVGLYREQLGEFQRDELAAVRTLAVGEMPLDAQIPTVELAAWTTVANLVLSLDGALWIK